MADEPCAARLRALLSGGAHSIFEFEMGQSQEERAALMALVPERVQWVARGIMTRIVEYSPCPEYDEKPLLYFMATDEEVDDWDLVRDWDVRQHSPDWRLIVHEDEAGLLCDFNGWPGDNQNGACVYLDIATGQETLVFRNSDSCLEAAYPAAKEVADAYMARREALAGEQSEEV